MRLTTNGNAIEYRATSIVDAFGALADAVAAIATGARSASVLWGDEPSAMLIEFAAADPDQIGLVITRLAMPDWLLPQSRPWQPLRGAERLHTLLPRAVALRGFRDGLRGVTAQLSDRGTIPGWNHSFPAVALAAIEAAVPEEKP
ncbi:MAG TPA: hypothetical protein VG756_11180 [Pseudonocardiaceae bacterium]|jgi:hypothetical protein|nr:hypothetical protein [Pseudonocardiaceae bacterium]